MKAISANNVWAVGENNVSTGLDFTLIEHWNGSVWSEVNSPSPGLALNKLDALDATSANDIWAVGSFTNGSGLSPSSTLIEHWNGSQWSAVPGINPGTGINELFGVAAISSNDVWAVGHFGAANSLADSMLTEHWNGSQWSVVPSPNPSTTANRLNSVTAISTNNVWTVGNFFLNGSQSQDQTAVEHWNGSQWSIVASADVPSSDDNLISVKAISTNDIWAVGLFSTLGGSGDAQTLTEHWDGTQWQVVASPDILTSDGLNGVSAVATNNVWAVGSGFNSNASISQSLIEHWNGTNWTVVNHPESSSVDFFNGATTLAGGNIWAVGSTFGKIVGRPLVETKC